MNYEAVHNNGSSSIYHSRKVKRFWQRALSGVTSGRKKNEFFAFLTLTSSPESPEKISQNWEKLKKRIQRKFGRFEYIWVREFTKSGLVHMHLILRGPYIPQDWISKNWQEVHKARIVHIEAIWHPEKTVKYMAKYLTKEMVGRFGYSWGWIFRRAVQVWKTTSRSVFRLGGNIRNVLRVWEFIIESMIGRERENLRWKTLRSILNQGILENLGIQVNPRL